MRDGWTETTLGEIANIQQGKTLAITTLVGGRFPVFGANGVVGYHDEANYFFDVVALGCRGSCGTIHLVTTPSWLANNAMALWPRSGESVALRFIALLLEVADLSGEGVISGQVQPQITRASLAPLRVVIPPMEEQRRIVDVVTSVDTYIDALKDKMAKARTARNAVLHELLSAGGPDWTETTLGDVADYINGFPFKPRDLGDDGVPVIRIKQLLDPGERCDRTTIDVPEKCVLKDGDVVFSWSGTLAVRTWDRGHAFLNQHLFRVVERDGIDRSWLLLTIDHSISDLVEKTHGTTMKHITKEKLLPHEILLPPIEEQRRIVDIISSMDDVVAGSEKAVAEAARLRSGLLSDLLSGEHEIPASYDSLVGVA